MTIASPVGLFQKIGSNFSGSDVKPERFIHPL
jgi:hypothetical protein